MHRRNYAQPFIHRAVNGRPQRHTPLKIMLRFLLIFLLVAPILLTGCAILTKSQVLAVNNFADLTNQGAGYPEKVLNQVIDSRYDSRVLLASLNTTTKAPLTYGALSKLYTQKQKEQAPVRRIEASVAVIGEYALALKTLSSPDFAKNAGTSAKALGKSVDNLTTQFMAAVPGAAVASVGDALGQTLTEVGGRYIGYRQTKAIRQYVRQGDKLVGLVTGQAESILQNSAAAFIDNIRLDDSTNINKLFRAIRRDDPHERYRFAITSFELVSKHRQLEELNQQAIRELQQIRVAHKELNDKLAVKQNLADVGRELVGLYEAIQDLQATYQKIKF